MSNIVTEEQVAGFVARCQLVVDAYFQKDFPTLTPPVLTFDYGAAKKFCRIVRIDRRKDENGNFIVEKGGAAWAFIDLTNGDVLKPSSYKTPAKHARGNIFDEHEGMEKIGAYGPAYLK